MTQQEFLNALPTAVRIVGDWNTRIVYVGNTQLRPEQSQKIRNHSPDGFNWGYSGSGPAQFALALLLLYVDQETAQQYYQQFKFGWVASLPQSNFSDTYNLRWIMRLILAKEPDDPDLYTTNEE